MGHFSNKKFKATLTSQGVPSKALCWPDHFSVSYLRYNHPAQIYNVCDKTQGNILNADILYLD